MKDYYLPIFIIILVLLAPDKIELPNTFAFDERENEGLAAFVVTSYVPAEQDEAKPKDCECNGTKQIITGDGVRLPCPCDNCQCKKKLATTEPQPQVHSQGIPYSDYYYVQFTASWCGPCKKFDREEQHKLEKLGIKVVEVDVDKNPQAMKDFGVTTVPTFLLCNSKDKTAYYDKNKPEKQFKFGNMSGESLIKKLEDHYFSRKVAQTPLLSQSEIDALVRASYTRNTPLMKAVMDRNANVYSHLKNEHGFTKDQVDGLESWVAHALHDAVHPPASITPWR
jgi:thiol-disulfide isomerase/thioredoxin